MLRTVLIVLLVAVAIAAKIVRADGGAPEWLRGPVGWIPSFAYGAGMPLLAIALLGRNKPRRTQRTLFLAGVAGAAVAEFTQAWEPGRTFAWSDLLALVVGAALAYLFETWFARAEPATVRE